MAAPVEIGIYKEVTLFLVTAGVIVPVFAKLRISPVLGFIGAGALLGPYGLGRATDVAPWLSAVTVGDRSEFAPLAELGIVFLLFTIGIELSWERLRTLRRLVFGLGGSQVVLCSAALTATGIALGLPILAAAVSGIALALSSTAIVVPILAEQRRLNSPTGRTSFAVLLFQDLAVAPVLFTITTLGSAGQGSFVVELATALAQAATAVVVILVLGRTALRPLFGLVAQSGSPELFMAASLLTIVGAGLLAATSGLSMALGAFMAGLLLAETEYRRAIEGMIDPFKGLLLGLFFVSIGMGLDVTAIVRQPVGILAVAGGLILVKVVVVAAVARLAFRLPRRVALETAILLGPGGEFAFVITGAGVAAGLLGYDAAQTVFAATTVTMISIPLLARLGRKLGRRIAAAAPPPDLPAPPADGTDRVIVAGFGRVGQLVADMLARHGVPYLAIDTNAALVVAQHASGKPVFYGDSTSPMFLRACGVETARAVVVTLDSSAASASLVQAVRQWRADVTIVARARDARHASELYRLGVTDAVPETIEASLQLSEAVLVDIGIAMGPVIASIHERRDEYRRTFGAASPAKSGEFRGRRTGGKR